jgi:hypothetical protein
LIRSSGSQLVPERHAGVALADDQTFTLVRRR